MKHHLALSAAVAAAILAFLPVKAEAGETYRSKIHSRCHHCGHFVHSYYRPVQYIGTRAIYSWIPAYHTKCVPRVHTGAHTRPHVHGNSNLRYRYGAVNRHNFGYQAGFVRRPVTTYRTYPGWRFSTLRPGSCR